jgi:hypothetical protein
MSFAFRLISCYLKIELLIPVRNLQSCGDAYRTVGRGLRGLANCVSLFDRLGEMHLVLVFASLCLRS